MVKTMTYERATRLADDTMSEVLSRFSRFSRFGICLDLVAECEECIVLEAEWGRFRLKVEMEFDLPNEEFERVLGEQRVPHVTFSLVDVLTGSNAGFHYFVFDGTWMFGESLEELDPCSLAFEALRPSGPERFLTTAEVHPYLDVMVNLFLTADQGRALAN